MTRIVRSSLLPLEVKGTRTSQRAIEGRMDGQKDGAYLEHYKTILP
jgi:hypothetical protein